MEIKIALAGNPNCGKTTLFNSLTGSNQFVGNWPGVTVEKKEGKLKGKKGKGEEKWGCDYYRFTRYLFIVSLYIRRSSCEKLSN